MTRYLIVAWIFLTTFMGEIMAADVPGKSMSVKTNTVRAATGKGGRIDQIFSMTKPVCFTRFVIDVPDNATVVFGRMTLDAEIRRYPEMAYDIDGFVSRQIERNKEDASIYGRGSETDKMAGRVIATKNDRLKHVVNIIGDDRYALYSFLVLGNDIYVMEDKGVLGADLHKLIQYNENTASALRGISNDDIPEQAGVCIDGAFAMKNPEYENIELGIRLKDFPDVHLSISLIKHGNYAEPQEEFIKRHNQALESGRHAGFSKWIDRLKYLRKAPRKLSDWTGDEILVQFPAWGQAKNGHQFAFWSTGRPNDPLHPQVDIRLDTGVKENTLRSVPASLTDEEAIVLWDRLLNSIRVRPVKAAKEETGIKIPDEFSDIRVGIEQRSGSICSASGWWQCFDAEAVEPIQWLAKGEKIPQVHFRNKKNFFDKISNTQKTVLGNGVWQLMRIDERK